MLPVLPIRSRPPADAQSISAEDFLYHSFLRPPLVGWPPLPISFRDKMMAVLVFCTERQGGVPASNDNGVAAHARGYPASSAVSPLMLLFDAPAPWGKKSPQRTSFSSARGISSHSLACHFRDNLLRDVP